MKARRAPAELTLAQAKNYAISLQEAIVHLGRSVRQNAQAMHASHKDRLFQLTEGLERLYWQAINLESETHTRLLESMQPKEVTDGPQKAPQK